jgi:hypothetical protein
MLVYPTDRKAYGCLCRLLALARCREAIDIATRVMRPPKEGDNMRLRAAELILDRGVGRPNQAVSLDMSLTKPLEAMSSRAMCKRTLTAAFTVRGNHFGQRLRANSGGNSRPNRSRSLQAYYKQM